MNEHAVAYFHSAEALIFRFWTIVDETSTDSGASLFTHDGVLQIDSFKAEGTEQLSDYFAARLAKSASAVRTTRHVVTNLRCNFRTKDCEKIDATVTVFSSYGQLPAAVGAPSTLADFSFDCRRQPSGDWLLSHVAGRLIFVSTDTPVNAAAQPSSEFGHG